MIARIALAVLLCLGGTLSRTPHCVGAELAQQVPPMPPPGNPGDQKPPDGAFCDRSRNEARHCKCHRKCVQDPNKPSDPNAFVVEEDRQCRAWCHRDHCHCPADCE